MKNTMLKKQTEFNQETEKYWKSSIKTLILSNKSLETSITFQRKITSTLTTFKVTFRRSLVPNNYKNMMKIRGKKSYFDHLLSFIFQLLSPSLK